MTGFQSQRTSVCLRSEVLNDTNTMKKKSEQANLAYTASEACTRSIAFTVRSHSNWPSRPSSGHLSSFNNASKTGCIDEVKRVQKTGCSAQTDLLLVELKDRCAIDALCDGTAEEITVLPSECGELDLHG